jgi:CRISPR-associated protein Cas2
MNMLITYDIANPKRLYRIAKVMEDYGQRVQYSVFEAELTSRLFKEMRLRTEAEMDFQEDGVKYFPLCKQCDYLWFSLGHGPVAMPESSFMVI